MAGIAAFGIVLEQGDTPDHQEGTTVYTAIAQVADFSGPSLSAENIDVTAHDSTGAFREYVPSFLDAGEVSFTLNFDPGLTNHTDFLNTYLNRELNIYQLTFPDTGSTQWRFSAYVTGFEMSAPLDDKLSADVTLLIAGAPTFVVT